MSKDQHRFQVNLKGIIALLSNNLYSGPEVFIRELLQNAVDANRARILLQPDFKDGKIEFSLTRPRGAPATLMVEDNGVGLTEEEVHRFLATIGESSKRDELGAAREDFIGQFGIGLLSCFMIADEIVLVTRSAREEKNAAAIEWRGKPDGTYTVRRLDKDAAPGTRVFLRCKEGAEKYFETEKLRELILHFGGILALPLWFSTGTGARVHLNDQLPPWREKTAPSTESLLAYGRELLSADFFDAIPLRSKSGDVEGVAYVLAQSPNPAAKQNHRLYLKNMLVSEQAQGMLPDWAFFVRCVLNSNKLRPTASREGFYEDAALEATREELGQCIRRWIMLMARQEPRRLSRFISIHYLAIKCLAVHDDEFYRIFIDMLPFETSRGQMTLGQYRAEHDKVLFAETVDQFRQIAAVAEAQNQCVINAGYTYDRDLLLRLTEFFPDLTVEGVDAESLTQTFEELTVDEADACFDLRREADIVLQRARCAVDIRRFDPEALVAIYSISDDGLLYRSARGAADQADEHWSGLLSSAIGDDGKAPYARLCLNYSNPLVQRLAQLTKKKLLRRLIELVYVQALLAGHHPLATHELKLLNEGLMELITLAAGSEGKGKS